MPSLKQKKQSARPNVCSRTEARTAAVLTAELNSPEAGEHLRLRCAAIRAVTKAMEIVGGEGFYRASGLERLFRDVQAARYHPLLESEQVRFSGEYLLRD